MKNILVKLSLFLVLGTLFFSAPRDAFAGYCSPRIVNITEWGCGVDLSNGDAVCQEQSSSSGCFYGGPSGTGAAGSCITDQYQNGCSSNGVDCNYTYSHEFCGTYIEDPPPSGGYGCVNGSCQWTSSGGGCASCAPSECGDGVTDLGEDCDAGPGGSSTCDTSCRTIVGQTCNWCTNQAQCLASGGSWSGPSNYCGVSGDGCCEGGPGFESSCQPTANICETGVGIAGANGTGCNSEMISYRNSAGQVTLAALKPDGSACPNVWGGRTDSGDTFGGLAVWKQTSDTVSGNDLLRPNYGYYNAENPEIITKNLLTLINNDDYKVSIDIGLASPSNSSAYLLNPACATNAGTNGFHRPYVFNDTQYRDQNDNIEAEKRWKAMRACYSKVVYEPIDCTVSSNKDTVVVGEEITISLFAGNRRPVHIDGGVPSPGYTARLFLEKTDFSEISPLPASLSYTNGQPGNRYYYQLSAASCTFDATSGKCNSTFRTSDLPVGSYKFHCDIPSVGAFEPQKCSGDPWCSYEGGGGSNICPDWISCSNNDNLNIVVTPGIPPTPTGLTSSCTSPGDKMTLSWDPVTGADSYLIRIDSTANNDYDGDDIDAVGYADDTCASNLDWDVCVDVSSAVTSLDIEYHPVNFESAIWRVYAQNGTGIGDYTETTLNTCIPNCYDLTGPDEIVKGQSGNFSATYFSGNANHFAALLAGQYNSGTGQYISRSVEEWTPQDTSCGLAGCTETFAWDTTDAEVGNYDIFCRTYNTGIASCRGNANYITGSGQYACRGPGITTKTVAVTPPEIKITGTVYEGIGNGTTNDLCNAGNPGQITGQGGMGVELTGPLSSTAPVNSGVYQSGTFTPGGVATAELINLPSGYQVMCPAGGKYTAIDTTSETTDITGVNFFISELKAAWWQTRSGLAYGSTMTSALPYNEDGTAVDPLCTPASGCVPYLVTGAVGDVDPFVTAGIPTGPTTGTSGYDSQHLNAADEYFSAATSHTDAALAEENYSVLSRRFDLAAAAAIGDSLDDVPTLGATPLQGDAEVYLYEGTGLELNADSWVIDGDRKIVIFADADVIINGGGTSPHIIVAPGSFFAVISSGDITFDQDIGATIAYPGTPTITPQIEGMYVADGILTVAAASDPDAIDKMFIGAGSFVGWDGVSLPRDFETVADPSTGLLNNYVPTDTFVFRPDFILNTPELMRRSAFNWREINSITQE